MDEFEVLGRELDKKLARHEVESKFGEVCKSLDRAVEDGSGVMHEVGNVCDEGGRLVAKYCPEVELRYLSEPAMPEFPEPDDRGGPSGGVYRRQG